MFYSKYSKTPTSRPFTQYGCGLFGASNTLKPRKTYYLDADNYFRFNNSHKLIHRWVVEKHIGRKLKTSEVIHHKDGNKWNNKIENLQICSWEEHEVIHKKHLEWYGRIREPKTIFSI